MTSTTITRPCEVAVVNNRSMHSVANPTAVSNPNVAVVVEIVVDGLGYADDTHAVAIEVVAERELPALPIG